jgi:hypothetical protein
MIYFLFMKEHMNITGQFLISSYMVRILHYDSRGCQNMQKEIRNFTIVYGACGDTVEALCYKLEGHGFDSQRCHWNFSLT